MEPLNALAAIAWIGFSFVALRKFAPILQAERYHTGAYLKWVVTGGGIRIYSHGRFDVIIHSTSLLLAVLALSGVFPWRLAAIPAIIAAVAWMAPNLMPEKEVKKPFVFTPRVKRLFVATCLIGIALLYVEWLLLGTENFPSGVIIFGYLQPLLLAAGSVAVSPVEGSIQNGFKKQARRKLTGKKVVAITGSYGKTGTKEAVAHLLETSFPLLKTPGSFNTPMGLCRTINSKMEPHHEIFVTEMGATRRGDIRELCGFVPPTVGIITSVGMAHFETFGSLDGVAAAKFELADALPPDGTLIYNSDYEICRRYAARRPQRSVTYGLQHPADYMPENIICGREGSTFDIRTPDGPMEKVKVRLLGKLHVLNMTAAFAAGRVFGITAERLKAAAASLAPVEARLQLVENPGSYLIINDGFNSNPVGAATAVETLGLFAGYRKVLVTPGIVDVGEKHVELNRAFGEAAAKYCDLVVLVNDRRTRPIFEGLVSRGFDERNIRIFPKLAEARYFLNGFAGPESVVLFENDLPDHMEQF